RTGHASGARALLARQAARQPSQVAGASAKPAAASRSARYNNRRVSTYQGTAQVLPSTRVASRAPGNQSSAASVGDAATSASSGSSAPSATNSATHVLPSWNRSGIDPPT